VGSFEQQGVCKHFLDQVDPTIRWVAGWLAGQMASWGGHTPSELQADVSVAPSINQ
jgi:hypothetical protein